MAVINVKAKTECKYDIVSLGEIMIRLDPGEERIHTTTFAPGKAGASTTSPGV